MKKEIKEKWVAALRSGKYKQGQGQLRDTNNNYCCLGVLCDLLEPENWIETKNKGFSLGFDSNGDVESYILPVHIQEIVNIDSVGTLTNPINDRVTLTELNDNSKFTFKQIADIIEEQF